MEANISENTVRRKLELYCQQRAERLRTIRLSDIMPNATRALNPLSTESAPEIVARLIEHYLASFEDWWKDATQDADFFLPAIRVKSDFDQRYDYETRLAHAHNRLTLRFIDEYCKPDYSIDWEKLVRFNSGKD